MDNELNRETIVGDPPPRIPLHNSKNQCHCSCVLHIFVYVYNNMHIQLTFSMDRMHSYLLSLALLLHPPGPSADPGH